MAELALARWQWDDQGQWRDFAEQHQAAMEAAFQQQEQAVEMEIAPFGTFRMDFRFMMQITIRGRCPGYERGIRRQAKRIPVEYFLLGEAGAVIASDSVLDKVRQPAVVESLVGILRAIIREPENFDHRSINLSTNVSLGRCKSAVEFLKEKGFELIREGRVGFLVFMGDEFSGLQCALEEAQAQLEHLRRAPPGGADDRSSDGEPSSSAEEQHVANEFLFAGQRPRKMRRKGGKGRKGADTRRHEVLSGSSRGDVPGEPAEGDAAETPAGPPASSGPLALRLQLPSGKEAKIEAKDGSLDELVALLRSESGFRLPLVRSRKPLALAADRRLALWEVAQLWQEEQMSVVDFEATFIEDLQSGLLRLRDLAFVSPLLDWEKPELLRLLLGRLRSLLEGNCDTWCKAAHCTVDEELRVGCALLCRLYGDKPVDARLEVCRRLLPAERPGVPRAKLRVKRADFLASAVSGLLALERPSLLRPFSVEFLEEIAEDHGGPRRDFFGTFGAQLAEAVPGFWRKLPNGTLAPVPDDLAEKSVSALPSGFGVEHPRQLYRACGRACGLAARHGDVLGEEFSSFFVCQVLRRFPKDVKELQQQLAELDASDFRSSEKILERDLNESGLGGQMTLSRVRSGAIQEVDLVPGGSEITVTDQNKAEWLELSLKDKLYDSLRLAADAFREGFLDVCGGLLESCPLLMLLSPSEFAKLLAGSAVTDDGVKRWREVAVVSGEVGKQAEWFWEVLAEGDEAFRGQVLKFTTGVHRISQCGLQTFEIQPADGDDTNLPHAMTCANMLQLPRYSSKEALGTQLRKATSLCEGFQIL